MNPNLEIYSDGSHRKGKSHYAFIVAEGGKPIYEEAGHARPHQDGFPGRVRSNDCEIFAALRAIAWVKTHRPDSPATLVTDSQSVAKAMESNPTDPYLSHLKKVLATGRIAIRKVRDNEGIPLNEKADRLARRGSRNPEPTEPSVL